MDSSDFDSAMIKLLQAHFGQYGIYWRYVPIANGVLEWMCSADGLSWWFAGNNTELFLSFDEENE